jgi:benzodiazapine receptor
VTRPAGAVGPSGPGSSSQTKTSQALWLIGLLAATYVAAGIGGAATAASVNGWYQTLQKPSWNPPDWIFGPVWTVLYFLMAIAAWSVWRRTGWPSARTPLAWFAAQLALNVGWSVIFFGLQRPGAAFAEILVLWLAIVATTVSFYTRSPWAAWLMIPYLAWTTFAVVLNAVVAKSNA